MSQNNDTTNELRRLLDVYDDTSVSLELCEQFAETVRELLNQTVTVHVTEEPAVGVKLVDSEGDTWQNDPAWFNGRWVLADTLADALQHGWKGPQSTDEIGRDFDELVAGFGPLTVKGA